MELSTIRNEVREYLHRERYSSVEVEGLFNFVRELNFYLATTGKLDWSDYLDTVKGQSYSLYISPDMVKQLPADIARVILEEPDDMPVEILSAARSALLLEYNKRLASVASIARRDKWALT